MAGFTPPSLLVITPVSGVSHFELTPFSARGLSQTLEQITSISGQGTPLGKLFRRDVNGTLVNLTYPQFQKYQSVITCKDTETPCLDGAWMGAVVDVQCAAELNFVTGSQSPQRAVVSGSERTEGIFTFYRPILTMMIVGIKNAFDEWGADYSWQLTAQEV